MYHSLIRRVIEIGILIKPFLFKSLYSFTGGGRAESGSRLLSKYFQKLNLGGTDGGRFKRAEFKLLQRKIINETHTGTFPWLVNCIIFSDRVKCI